MTDYPGPEQRVRAYLDENDKAAEHYDHSWDWLSGFGGADLYASDIRDVVNELDEHRSLLEAIDAQLDRLNGNNDAAVLNALSTLLGNHRKKGWED